MAGRLAEEGYFKLPKSPPGMQSHPSKPFLLLELQKEGQATKLLVFEIYFTLAPLKPPTCPHKTTVYATKDCQ